MSHIVFIQDGNVCQCSKASSVPTGAEYWNVLPEEKEWMDNNRDKREAWVLNPTRPADGVGE